MRKVILAVIALATIVGTSVNAQAQSKDVVAIENVMQNYFAALNASDANKVVSLFTSNGVLQANAAPTATGTEQLKGTFQYVFDNFIYTLAQTIGEIKVKGKMAYVISTSKGSFVIKASKQKLEDNYRELFTLEKTKGEWKISQYMYNKSK